MLTSYTCHFEFAFYFSVILFIWIPHKRSLGHPMIPALRLRVKLSSTSSQTPLRHFSRRSDGMLRNYPIISVLSLRERTLDFGLTLGILAGGLLGAEPNIYCILSLKSFRFCPINFFLVFYIRSDGLRDRVLQDSCGRHGSLFNYCYKVLCNIVGQINSWRLPYCANHPSFSPLTLPLVLILDLNFKYVGPPPFSPTLGLMT